MTKRKPKIEIYKARDGWRWRVKSANGKVVADSGEAYRRKPDARFIYNLSVTILDAGHNVVSL